MSLSLAINYPSLTLYLKVSSRVYSDSLLNLNILKKFIAQEGIKVALLLLQIFQKMKLNSSEECSCKPCSRMRLATFSSSISVNISSKVYLYQLLLGILLRYPKQGCTIFMMMTGLRGRSTLKAWEYSYPNLMNLQSANRSQFLSLAVNIASYIRFFCKSLSLI